MTAFAVKLPDVGEGVAEAELVSWYVAVGEHVTPESVLAEVLTDKATVEISSPVAGVVSALHGEPGDVLAVGGELVTLELDDESASAAAPSTVEAPPPPSAPPPEPPTAAPAASPAPAPAAPPRQEVGSAAPTAAPAVRARARELGIDLSSVHGTGPDGRVVHADLDQLLKGDDRPRATTGTRPAGDDPKVVPIRGIRRRIAERVSESWTQIPHITYVDSVDATQLEALRAELNKRETGGSRLTLLPFIVRAIVIACGEQPRLNSRYDAQTQELLEFDAVHVGIATQTDAGLVVPVLRHAEARGLHDIAAEIVRVSSAARDGSAAAHELTGSTITITSLGSLGGIATTPIINRPEVAIIGVNKLEVRPVWIDGAFVPRKMFNLSSSFDHRIIDGWDAATFVQRIKTLLEVPALLFMDEQD